VTGTIIVNTVELIKIPMDMLPTSFQFLSGLGDALEEKFFSEWFWLPENRHIYTSTKRHTLLHSGSCGYILCEDIL